MIKVCFYAGENELGPTVVPLFNRATDSYFEKVAAPTLQSDVISFIKVLRPQAGSIYNLVNALGAGEFFGSNTNGDYFSEGALMHKPDDWTGNPLLDKIKFKDWPYGFPTFYQACVYQHHRNKDPDKRLGDIEFATWNERMKRVELVTRVDKVKCEQHGAIPLWDKLSAGRYLDLSMGAKVKFDMCSLCSDWKLYREAEQTFDKSKHKAPDEAILWFHKNKQKIRGLSITRADYCFPPGTPILMVNGTWKCIQDVHIGDEVVTHTGAFKKVTKLLPSCRLDTVVSIQAWGMLSITSTGNHPFLTIRPTRSSGLSRLDQMESTSLTWTPAEDVGVKDLVLQPLLKISNKLKTPKLLGRLLGLYLAEGHPVFSSGVTSPKAVAFTFALHEEDFAKDVLAASKLIDPKLTHRISKYKDRKAFDIFINSHKVAAWLLKMGGKGSLTKVLSPHVWLSGVGFCRELLRGWVDGDGSYDLQRSLIRAVTSSEELARQVQSLSGSLGITCAINQIERTSNYCHQIVWYLSFSGDAACAVKECRPQQKWNIQSKLFLWNNYLVSSIRGIHTGERDGDWYNFEVEDDHSYVAGGYAVHNCEHASKYMNRIFPDGRKSFVYNPYPKFFDQSYVFIGADKTSKGLMKLGHGYSDFSASFISMPSAKVAEAMGYVDVEVSTKVASVQDKAMEALFGKYAKTKESEIVKDTVPSQFAGKAVPLLSKSDVDLPRDMLDTLGRAPLESSLSTTGGLGVVLKPKEFQRIIMIQIGRKDLADEFEDSGTLFPHTDSRADMDLGPGHFMKELLPLLSSIMASRSCLSPHVDTRAMMSLPPIKEDDGDRQTEKKKLASVFHYELLQKIGAAYNTYRDSFLELMVHSQELLSSFPSSNELSKLAMLPVEDVFSPLSVAYAKFAFLDEVSVSSETKPNL